MWRSICGAVSVVIGDWRSEGDVRILAKFRGAGVSGAGVEHGRFVTQAYERKGGCEERTFRSERTVIQNLQRTISKVMCPGLKPKNFKQPIRVGAVHEVLYIIYLPYKLEIYSALNTASRWQ